MVLTTHIDDRGIASVCLNRPDVHNAFNAALIADLQSTFSSLSNNIAVRAIVLKGNGKSFSAGADLNWMKEAATYSEQENIDDAMRLSGMLDTIYHCSKPVIAIAHGAAMGGGVGLLSCADIAIGIDGTKFALSEAKLGLAPSTISPFVIAAIGPRNARRYFQTAERFDTAAALKIGLLHEVVSDQSAADAYVSKLLDDILKNGPDAVTESKSLVTMVEGQPIDENLRMQTAKHIAARRASAEGKEGLSAFLEKRKPTWIKD